MPTARKGYYIDGKRVPSVTTIISDWPEGAIRWAEKGAAEAVAEYAFAGVYGQMEPVADVVAAGLHSWRAMRDDTRDAGSWCHHLIERYLGLESEEPSASIRAQELGEVAFRNWARWWETAPMWNGLTTHTLHAEEHILSKAHLYGGTPDLIVREAHGERPEEYSEEVWIYDWKTSAEPKIRSGHLLQLAAYGMAAVEQYGYTLAGVMCVGISNQPGGDVIACRVPWKDMGPACVQFLAQRAMYEMKKHTDALTRERIATMLRFGGDK